MKITGITGPALATLLACASALHAQVPEAPARARARARSTGW
jgi:hypothetical protein